MKAFVERLSCGEHLIVRVGEDASAYGKPWRRRVFGEYAGPTVTLVAYEEEEYIEPMTADIVKAVVRALLDDQFEHVDMDRLGVNPRGLRFMAKANGEIGIKLQEPHYRRAA
ncbi:MAG TPA: hypothetical protein VK846_12955 [Candidatus Limnocylindria bacterium]|nr:hypothetical protein [Candidatus Limnocylindria bacterium]